MRDPVTGLTDLQAAFVREYSVDHNATQAYIRAGGSAKAAEVNACRLLRKDKVATLIAEAEAKRAVRCEITGDRVVMELARIAFSDMRHFAKASDNGVRLEDSDDWTDDDAAAVAEFSETTSKEGGSIKFKLHDKIRALDLLGKHLGLFPKDGANINIDARSVTLGNLSAAELARLREVLE